MIEHNRAFGIFEIACDRCPSGHKEVDADFGWGSMIAEIKEDGWKVLKDADGDWTHICPACDESENDIDNILEGFPS